VDIHYEESQRLEVTIYHSHNSIMPIWPVSQDFRIRVGADHVTAYRPTRTVHFEDRTEAYDLLEKAKNFLSFHRLFMAYSYQLLKSRSAAARSVEHLRAGVKPTW
jgi:hypothetical protein